MGKKVHDDVLNALLAEIETGVKIYVCGSAEPADLAAARADTLASRTLAGGDYSRSDAASGRYTKIAQQGDITVASTATAGHVCIGDGTVLLLCTTCTAQLLTAGNTVTIPAFKDNVQDPT